MTASDVNRHCALFFGPGYLVLLVIALHNELTTRRLWPDMVIGLACFAAFVAADIWFCACVRPRRAGGEGKRVDGCVELELLDDGVGCGTCSGGNGLRGLCERVAARDGTVTFGSRPQGGFRLAVSLPVRDEAPPAPGRGRQPTHRSRG